MKKRVGKELGNKRKNWGKNWGKLPLPVDTQEAFCNIYTPDRLRRIPVLECPIGEVAKDITIRFLDRRYLRKVCQLQALQIGHKRLWRVKRRQALRLVHYHHQPCVIIQMLQDALTLQRQHSLPNPLINRQQLRRLYIGLILLLLLTLTFIYMHMLVVMNIEHRAIERHATIERHVAHTFLFLLHRRHYSLSFTSSLSCTSYIGPSNVGFCINI